MITTTIEPASSKDSSSLSSSDLVSRFLAATPSYLYNVPPIQQNFYFSEMLRSFLPLQNDTVLSNSSHVRRRKRSWRDSRDVPLELTTNKKNDCQYHSATQSATFQYHHHHHPQSSHVQQYPLLLQNHEHSFDLQLQNSVVGTKTRIDNIRILDDQTAAAGKKQELKDTIGIEEREIEQKNKSIKKIYLERLPLNLLTEPLITSDTATVKIDEFQNISSRANSTDESLLQYSTKSSANNIVLYPKNKLESKATNFFSKIAGLSENTYPISNYRLPSSTSSDFLQSPLWHPQYSFQTHPTIDPLHFFIDLRVSGHIWDRSTNQKNIFPRSKHSSAFNVPQPKEYNKPLNLTRNESTIIRSLNKSATGTHHIFKNIKQIYQKIWVTENLRKDTLNKNFNDVIPLQKTQIISLKTDQIDGIMPKQKKKEL